MVSKVTGSLTIQVLFDRLSINHLIQLQQWEAVDVFGNHGLCSLPEEGGHGKSPKCLGGDFGEFCKGLYLTFRTFMISCNKLHATIYIVQDNLSTKEHINRTFYVRITLSLIYRNSKMFTHKKSAPKGAFILNSLTIIYRSVHLISLCVYLLPPLR